MHYIAGIVNCDIQYNHKVSYVTPIFCVDICPPCKLLQTAKIQPSTHLGCIRNGYISVEGRMTGCENHVQSFYNY